MRELVVLVVYVLPGVSCLLIILFNSNSWCVVDLYVGLKCETDGAAGGRGQQARRSENAQK